MQKVDKNKATLHKNKLATNEMQKTKQTHDKQKVNKSKVTSNKNGLTTNEMQKAKRIEEISLVLSIPFTFFWRQNLLRSRNEKMWGMCKHASL